ncbi:hypothetical protein HPB51_025756 [Rhipicephalus microplus]|uniref:Uncharacterized protein n=1 Tax=Rhipicephalus microplus TaxID=6941 RepID=A0A9J6DE55_RHIMP|nr:hypothetical protein HPB51_025756 [Rhipicephalus microplus]
MSRCACREIIATKQSRSVAQLSHCTRVSCVAGRAKAECGITHPYEAQCARNTSGVSEATFPCPRKGVTPSEAYRMQAQMLHAKVLAIPRRREYEFVSATPNLMRHSKVSAHRGNPDGKRSCKFGSIEYSKTLYRILGKTRSTQTRSTVKFLISMQISRGANHRREAATASSALELFEEARGGRRDQILRFTEFAYRAAPTNEGAAYGDNSAAGTPPWRKGRTRR